MIPWWLYGKRSWNADFMLPGQRHSHQQAHVRRQASIEYLRAFLNSLCNTARHRKQIYAELEEANPDQY